MTHGVNANRIPPGGSCPPGLRRFAGRAQPCPTACPSWSVTVTHQVDRGLRAAAAARSRARSGSMRPVPGVSPARSARPSRVASGTVRVTARRTRPGPRLALARHDGCHPPESGRSSPAYCRAGRWCRLRAGVGVLCRAGAGVGAEQHAQVGPGAQLTLRQLSDDPLLAGRRSRRGPDPARRAEQAVLALRVPGRPPRVAAGHPARPRRRLALHPRPAQVRRY
jgi:hypothetical protein